MTIKTAKSLMSHSMSDIWAKLTCQQTWQEDSHSPSTTSPDLHSIFRGQAMPSKKWHNVVTRFKLLVAALFRAESVICLASRHKAHG